MKEGKVLLVKSCKIVLGVVLILCSTDFEVSAYGTGAPPYSCDSMKPCHGTKQQGQSPFTVTFSPNVVTPGSQISVTLAAESGRSFIGFLVEVFNTKNQQSSRIGRFNGPSNTQRVCEGGKGLTHRNRREKTSLTFTWIAPSHLDKVVLKVTFVEEYQKYWMKQVELPLYSSSGNAPAASEAAPNNASPVETYNVQVGPGGQFWS